MFVPADRRGGPGGPARAQGTDAVMVLPSAASAASVAACTSAARSPGANPVRTAAASAVVSSQVTLAQPTEPSRCASTSASSPYSALARPSRPPPDWRAGLARTFSATTTVTNASVRTDADVKVTARSSLTRRDNAGPSARRCAATHWVRSAPSSGTVRTCRTSIRARSVRASTSSSWDRPSPIRCRAGPSTLPRPGWTTRAVAAQVWAAWSWITATRVIRAPRGGPSWTWIADRIPGRSASSGSGLSPTDTLPRNADQPATRPTACVTSAPNHCVADRPRTGISTSISAPTQPSRQSPARAHCCTPTASSNGIPATVTVASCGPVMPKNQPTRSRV